MTKINRLRIVIDTNVFLVSIAYYSPFHWLYRLYMLDKLDVLVSNEVFSEYREKFAQKLNPNVAESVLKSLEDQRNAIHIEPSFHFQLIKNDPDDNKFVDLAIAGNADYIVTNDKHFSVLSEIEFPKVNCVTVQQFEQIAKELALI